MRKPVIGIIGNHDIINGEYPAYTSGAMNAAAIALVSGGMPLIVPANLILWMWINLQICVMDFYLRVAAQMCIPASMGMPRLMPTAPLTVIEMRLLSL